MFAFINLLMFKKYMCCYKEIWSSIFQKNLRCRNKFNFSIFCLIDTIHVPYQLKRTIPYI